MDRYALNDVRTQELTYIVERRRKTAGPDGASDHRARVEAAHSLVGIALSGGGIRSATTNLGILQALSRMGVLPLADYVSTVSGGGYIGACLSALLSITKPAAREGGLPADGAPDFRYRERSNLWFSTAWPRFPFNPDSWRWNGGDPDGPLGRRIVAHLRTHGNFLIARRGILRRDAMRSIGHLLTGTVYNLLMCLLVLFVMTVGLIKAAHALTDDMAERLKEMTPAVVEEPARSEIRGNDNARLFVVQPTRDASAFTHFTDRVKVAANDVRDQWKHPALVTAAATGVVLSLLALAFFLWATFRSRWPPEGHPGSTREETLEGTALGTAAIVLAIATVGASLAAARVKDGTGLAFLLIPFAVFAGARVAGFVTYVGLTMRWRTWQRRARSLWGAYQAIATYGMIAGLLFALLPIAAYAAGDVGIVALIAPAVTLIGGRALVSRGASTAVSRFKIPREVHHFLLGLFALTFIGIVAVAFGGKYLTANDRPWLWLLGVPAGFLLLFANINRIGPHYFYRDRLMETYLRTEFEANADGRMDTLNDTMEMRLRDLHGEDPERGQGALANTAPYLLISAAINLAGSRDLTRKDRKSGYFLFSKYFCGSVHTGYVRTDQYRGGGTRIGRAITISGAAAATGMGQNTFFAQSFFMALFNLRLGYWMENPRHAAERWWSARESRAFWPWYLLREMFGLTNERTHLVNLSDGGHTGDNVGIYPLLQRRCQVIIACDAEQDGDLAFNSFTEALRHAYVDLNVDVDIDLDMIRKDPQTGFSRSHCAIGRIRYRECPNRPNWLIYLKNSLTGDEPVSVLNYRQVCADFPHETTADQFFDDAQFESYRALGVHLAETTFAEWTSRDDVAQLLNRLNPHWEAPWP
jgi:hypothetical protein